MSEDEVVSLVNTSVSAAEDCNVALSLEEDDDTAEDETKTLAGSPAQPRKLIESAKRNEIEITIFFMFFPFNNISIMFVFFTM